MTLAADPSRTGELVGGKYRIGRLLAKGGMGVVYEGQHEVVRRRFAIKFLRRELAARRDILVRFQNEAAAAGALENENVAAAVDFGIADDGTPYIVMEYLVGESLATLAERDGRLPVSRAADLIVQACRGVAAAHAAGIIHRDLKPQNLFVCRRDDGTDRIKVLDFGVAKLHAVEEANAATRTGTMLGTAAYMSPEQARGEKTVDLRTDVYALGAILYELVSQKRPHPGDSQNAILHHIATHAAVPLASVQPDLPAAFVEVVGRALASDPAARPGSAATLAEELTPFARRQPWPEPPAEREAVLPGRRESREAKSHARPRSRALASGAMIVAALGIGAGIARKVVAPTLPTAAKPARRPPRLDPGTRFLSSEPPAGAVAQIGALLQANATRDAALLSAMVATPTGIWFLGGTPEQVRADVSDAVARGGRQGRVPILVAYNHPFRDCTGYGLIGAADSAAYNAWIDGFAAGIGNERAIVILEPNSLGLIPYGVHLDGRLDGCRPTHASLDGERLPSPGANPEARYGELDHALGVLAAKAPNASVYLDGTHSSWLTVGDAAHRLARAGVNRAAGFFVNAGNFQPTRRLIQYGTWIAKCLHHAAAVDPSARAPAPYAECATPSDWMDATDDVAWDRIDPWYVEHVDRAAPPPSGPEALAHFVINTNRNGRGPLDAGIYAGAPYNQPPAIVEALRMGAWCMPPGRGLGLRPTADTRVPLVDAYLWLDTPGVCVASCDIAGGARAWDYGRYNPWGITGDAQNHFDPLWGRVLPPTGDWFPDEALELARYASPPLAADAPTTPAQNARSAGGRATSDSTNAAR